MRFFISLTLFRAGLTSLDERGFPLRNQYQTCNKESVKMLRALQAGTSALIQFEREGGERPAVWLIAPSSIRACTAAARNGRRTGTLNIRHIASIAGSIGGALVRSTCRGATASCSLLEASS